MPLDHSRANVTISIAGLALACINTRKRNRCEIGILRCERHKPLVDIQRILLDPETRTPVRSSLIPHSLSLDDDIFVQVNHSDSDEVRCAGGVSTYMRREFDRLDDTGDGEDFRWIADLEGPEFHNRKLKLTHRYKLNPTIFINEGVLYTREKTENVFARVPVKGRSPSIPLGRFAYGLNTDIACAAGSEVILSNHPAGESTRLHGDCMVRLPQSEFTQYLITIENHCKLAEEEEGTDFRLFYDVVEDPGGEQYDLRRIVETGCHAAPEARIGDRMDFSLDGFPQNCLVGYLGETQTLETEI